MVILIKIFSFLWKALGIITAMIITALFVYKCFGFLMITLLLINYGCWLSFFGVNWIEWFTFDVHVKREDDMIDEIFEQYADVTETTNTAKTEYIGDVNDL